MTADARQAAELAARTSYGRLLSLLMRRTRDIAAAEDALAEAFASALTVWPERGVPDSPDAWLLTAARRVVGHGERHGKVRAGAQATLDLLADEHADRGARLFADERLKLLFVCAHPAIDESVRAPLMMQTVLGMEAARSAGAFLVAPAAMSQRLVRAKAKIRDAGLRFEIPEADALPDRLSAVLDAIYAAYTVGWEVVSGAEARAQSLAAEALFLARLVRDLMPHEPEPMGLVALILYCMAREPARRDASGAYVPLSEQSTRLWDRDLLVEAEQILIAASRMARPGRFQTEAALQSLHVQAVLTGRDITEPRIRLYDALVHQTPSIGARIARATAHAERDGPAAGLGLLDEVSGAGVTGYQPYWAARFHLLKELGRGQEAKEAAQRAMALTEDPAVRAWISRQLERLT